jgi:hypothetical protein
MSVTAEVLVILHHILQVGFIGVTFLLMLVALVNRFRVQDVLLAWRPGRWSGLPLWPTVFLGAVLAFFGLAAATQSQLPLSIFAGYLVGGLFWFVAAWHAAAVLITEQGILRDAQQPEDCAIAWVQIADYFEAPGGPPHYVFFYLDEHDERRRLELPVPPAHEEAFREVLDARLDARFDLFLRRAYGKQALEG